MSDIYVPGVKSRFNTEKLIEDLMKVERVPRDRVERNVESLETNKGYWQEIGRRINSVRDSSRLLFSFQNPFNERMAFSADESVITASATREAVERDYRFTVQQVAQADRFISPPLENGYRVEGGTYTFTVGKDEISFNFRGGTLQEFTDTLNRRGRDKIGASLINVERGAKSLLIESKLTGAENRLGFAAGAEKLALQTGIAERVNDSRRDFAITSETVEIRDREKVLTDNNTLRVNAGASASIPLSPALYADPSLVIQFDTAVERKTTANTEIQGPPPGPAIPGSGSVSYGGITIENDPSSTPPLPEWTPPPPPVRVDNLAVLSLTFSDGSTGLLPPVADTGTFSTQRYPLNEIAGGKTVVSLDVINNNTHRDISLRNISVFDPAAVGGFKPQNPISTAQDALITMEGIEIRRPVNEIDDLIPGVTVTPRSPSDRPVTLSIKPDREAVKDAIITLVGNYNQLMAEINVLTRRDDRIVEELAYLNADEQGELKKRLGAFQGDSTLNQLRSALQRAVSAPYLTDEERNLALLAQIGIGTDVRRGGAGGGYDQSRLRGYLEIDERALDSALETKLPAIKQLFGNDTDGDLVADSGVGYTLETLTKPYVETGGIISLKTGTIDSRIGQDRRRIETMERQLAAKEAELKVQYGRMEAAYNRMEQMSTSFDNFSQRAGGTGR
ncbi:MAG: flagellar filament capping protein FliD [Treponema sp.]|jgi:flagellar hook-associated protein 2|nr:flagellar filament capping protein FliD [Treponema sp.]